MNDADIIKALECCAVGHGCSQCIYRLCVSAQCITNVMRDALDLINRQKAEIERLRAKVEKRTNEKLELGTFYKKKLKATKSEVIKEFAERLKESAFECDVSFGYGREHYTEAVAVVEINNLVQEMTEENNA